MSAPVASGLTRDDLARFPDDHLRRELIDGERYMTSAPVIRHQQAVVAIAAARHEYVVEHGGLALPAPTDVALAR